MKKKLLFLIMMALPTWLMAQETKIPTWKKFAIVTTDGVNLRKEPNAQSPKLMSYWSGLDSEDAKIQWQTPQTPKSFEAFHLEKDQCYPIIETKGEWVKLWIADVGEFFPVYRDVWIMKKFVTEAPCQPLIDKVLNNTFSSEGMGFYHRYKGGTVLHPSYGFMDEVGIECGFMAGEYCAVFPDLMSIGLEYDESLATYRLNDNMLTYGKKYARFVGNDGDMPLFDPAKISEETALQLFKNTQKEKNYTVMYNIYGKLVTYHMSATNYPHELMTPTTPVSSQTPSTVTTQSSSDVYEDVVEQAPTFNGDLKAFLAQNVKYPKKAMENGVQGRVMVQFIVETNGSISNVKVVRSVDPELDAEALRVVKKMPKWTPGMQKGKAVRVRFTLPISFRLASTTRGKTN